MFQALSGVGAELEKDVVNSTALQTALNTQFLFQIGVFTAIPMIMGFILEQGVLKVVVLNLFCLSGRTYRLVCWMLLTKWPMSLDAGFYQFRNNAAAVGFRILHVFVGHKNSLLWSDYSSWRCQGMALAICIQCLASVVYFVEVLQSTSDSNHLLFYP